MIPILRNQNTTYKLINCAFQIIFFLQFSPPEKRHEIVCPVHATCPPLLTFPHLIILFTANLLNTLYSNVCYVIPLLSTYFTQYNLSKSISQRNILDSFGGKNSYINIRVKTEFSLIGEIYRRNVLTL